MFTFYAQRMFMLFNWISRWTANFFSLPLKRRNWACLTKLLSIFATKQNLSEKKLRNRMKSNSTHTNNSVRIVFKMREKIDARAKKIVLRFGGGWLLIFYRIKVLFSCRDKNGKSHASFRNNYSKTCIVWMMHLISLLVG